MAYALEPWIKLISVPVAALFPDGGTRSYPNGHALADDPLDRRYAIEEILAEDGTITLRLHELTGPEATGNITFF